MNEWMKAHVKIMIILIFFDFDDVYIVCYWCMWSLKRLLKYLFDVLISKDLHMIWKCWVYVCDY
jgi:hypothetical protein